MSIQATEFPSGWVPTTVGELVEPRSGKAVPSSMPDARFIGLEQIEAHTMRLLGTVAAGSMKSAANEFQPTDVLYGRLRAYLNKVYQPDFAGLCSGEFIVLPESLAVLGRFLKYRLNAGDFVRFSSQANTGDRPRVDFDQLKLFPLLLPPRNEQSRIAEALDELLSDFDAGVAALERVRAKLAQYRASVLKAAVDGTLTAEWRAAHPNTEPATKLLERILVDRQRRWEEDQLRKFKDKGQEPPKNWRAKYVAPASLAMAMPPLPEGWCWATLDQLGRLDRGRSKHRPRDAAFLYGGGYPFIQTGDVRRARQYIRAHTQTYSEAGLRQSRLWHADTLCITIAANIAETAILSYPACFPDSIVGVSFQDAFVSVRYVELFIQAAKSRISSYAPATAQKNINNEILRRLAVPLCPVAEQSAIVDIVEDQLSVADHLEADLDAKLKSAQALRQAILRHAFTGQLVPQDPNDEPASELLRRIGAEREARGRRVAADRPAKPRRESKASRDRRPRKRRAQAS